MPITKAYSSDISIGDRSEFPVEGLQWPTGMHLFAPATSAALVDAGALDMAEYFVSDRLVWLGCTVDRYERRTGIRVGAVAGSRQPVLAGASLALSDNGARNAP
jgi:hypothetical protein